MHCLVIKAALVLFFDIFTITAMFLSKTYTNRVFEGCHQKKKNPDGDVRLVKHECVPISYRVGKWIFLGCVAVSIFLVSVRHAGLVWGMWTWMADIRILIVVFRSCQGEGGYSES